MNLIRRGDASKSDLDPKFYWILDNNYYTTKWQGGRVPMVYGVLIKGVVYEEKK